MDPNYKYVAPEKWDLCNNDSFVYEDFNIAILPYNELPYVNHLKEVAPKQWHDDDSIPMLWGGGTQAYHPVFMIQYSLDLLDVYHETNDPSKLAYVQKMAKKLVELCIPREGVLYLPYSWDYKIHKLDEETIFAPWYSGMAQGQFLSLLCRLNEITGDEKYMEDGEKVFQSFTKFKGLESNPWVSCIDSSGNLWLEEYPRYQPCFTLNGMIFAIYGLYDYYRLTENEEVGKYLKASMTTIKVNAHKYRVVGDRSLYCLKHKLKVPSFRYQRIHASQMHMLHKITGDPLFKEVGDQFKEDIAIVEAEFVIQQQEARKRFEKQQEEAKKAQEQKSN